MEHSKIAIFDVKNDVFGAFAAYNYTGRVVVLDGRDVTFVTFRLSGGPPLADPQNAICVDRHDVWSIYRKGVRRCRG